MDFIARRSGPGKTSLVLVQVCYVENTCICHTLYAWNDFTCMAMVCTVHSYKGKLKFIQVPFLFSMSSTKYTCKLRV